MRKRKLFDPTTKDPFPLSRSRIERFVECPYCFYIENRLGVKRPSMPAFSLNIAVDNLLKKEFDIHRAKKVAHPLMKAYDIKAIPFGHPQINDWRNNFVGIRFHHQPTNFIVFGAVDDIWQNENGNLIVVDYKATSTQQEITLESKYRQAYKRQAEIYQWLLEKNGFKVSKMAYFVYANGDKDKKSFDGKLEFDVQIIPYEGNNKWVEQTLFDALRCLSSNSIPKTNPECEYCQYRQNVQKIRRNNAS